jgi:hypothetical protein
MGVREYARRRDVRHSSVQEAINSGRIASAVRKDAKGNPRIDAEAADKLWQENTDPAEQRGVHASSEEAAERPVSRSRGPSYAESRAIREAYEARLCKLQFDKAMGDLLPRAEIETSTFRVMRASRDAMLSLPDRLSAEVASMSDERQVHARISKEVEAIQAELADGLARLAAG